jgi:hypothetical protein
MHAWAHALSHPRHRRAIQEVAWQLRWMENAGLYKYQPFEHVQYVKVQEVVVQLRLLSYLYENAQHVHAVDLPSLVELHRHDVR